MPAFVAASPCDGFDGFRKSPHSNVVSGIEPAYFARASTEDPVSGASHHKSGLQGWPKEKSTILGLLALLHVADPKYGSSPANSSFMARSSVSRASSPDLSCPMVGRLAADQLAKTSPARETFAWRLVNLPGGISRKGESPRFRFAPVARTGSKRVPHKHKRLPGAIAMIAFD